MKALFYEGGYLSEWLKRRGQEAENGAHAVSPDRVLATPESDLVDELYEQFAVKPLELGEPYTPGPHDVRVNVAGDFLRAIDGPGPVYVRGTRVEVRIPFTGHSDLWDLRASQSTTRLPRGELRRRELVLVFDEPADSMRPETFRDRTQSGIADIRRFVAFAAADCDQFNRGLRSQLVAAVTARKQKVLADRNIAEFLPVQVRPRGSNDPAVAVVLPQRRKPLVAMPVTTKSYVPEPALSPEQYASILHSIRDWALAVGRLPETFRPMPEEALRDNLLVSLNGQFGAIGSEMFSRKGKTDILIQQPDGAVFIAECKFWEGQVAFEAALGQLLGYLVWRDTKSALVLFIRDGDVSSIIEKANEAIRRHPRYKRPASPIADSRVYVLHHEQDLNREIEVAVVVVPVPATMSTKRTSSGTGRRRRSATSSI